MASLLSLTPKISSKPGKRWTVRPILLSISSTYFSSYLGKYVGNRPVKLKKADNSINPVEIGHRKARQLEKELKKNRHKPY